MLSNKTIAVVVPAYNEEKQIGKVIETMPDFVDRIVIVNDNSTDSTADVVLSYLENDQTKTTEIGTTYNKIVKNDYNEAEIVLQKNLEEELKHFTFSEIVNSDDSIQRIILINNMKNIGVGGAIARGYKWCKDHGIDCTAVMAGDGQMDPNELEEICKPVIDEDVDYVKGNRLIHRSARFVMPKRRYFGNSILSIMTKVASGYWRVSDTQTGYTAISLSALKAIDIHKIYKRYGMPNDMLVKLNIAGCSLREIPIKPVYGVGEKSKMKINRVIPKIMWLLITCFFKRLYSKYFVRDFHPLFLLYHLSFLMSFISLPFTVKILKHILKPSGCQSRYSPRVYLCREQWVSIIIICDVDGYPGQ